MEINTLTPSGIARINGVALNTADESLSADDLRQRACSELLRQAAVGEGLLSADDVPGTDGILSEAATQAIEALLERKLTRMFHKPSDPAEL